MNELVDELEFNFFQETTKTKKKKIRLICIFSIINLMKQKKNYLNRM